MQKTVIETAMCYFVCSGLMVLGDVQFCQHHVTRHLVIFQFSFVNIMSHVI